MPTSLTLHELAARLRRGAVSSTEATEAYLRRIEALDPQVRAFLTVSQFGMPWSRIMRPALQGSAAGSDPRCRDPKQAPRSQRSGAAWISSTQ